MTSHLLVRDLSEDQLLGRILPLLPTPAAALVGPGDDCAVLAAPDARYVVTTDVLVEGHHFRTAWSTGYDVGWRAAMQNLADVVAMGARPTALVVALVLPARTPVGWVEDLARGMADACATVGAGVVGGDLSGGESLVVAVTAHGDLAGRDPVLRSGARPGDVIALAGTLGRSAAGLALLGAGWTGTPGTSSPAGGWPSAAPFAQRGCYASCTGPEQLRSPAADRAAAPAAPDAPDAPAAPDAPDAPDDVDNDLAALVAAYRRPDPPLAADTRGASAMLDVSDGLLRDAGRLAGASGVGVDLREAGLDVDMERLAPAARWLGERDPRGTCLTWALTGGEDHALLAAFPPGRELPAPFRPIGVVTPGPAGAVLLDGDVPPVSESGWDHFAGA